MKHILMIRSEGGVFFTSFWAGEKKEEESADEFRWVKRLVSSSFYMDWGL